MLNIQEKLGRRLSQRRIQQISLVFVGFLVIGSVSYFGTQQKKDSSAAVPGTMYASPASGTYAPGSTISVAIREESGTAAVNSVQAALVYNPAQLEYVSVTDGTAFPFVVANSTSTVGEVRVARGVNSGSAGVTGDNLVTTVNFRVLATSGTTNLSFNTTNNLSMIVRASDNTNIMTSSIPASYTIQYPAPTLSTVAPISGPTAGGTALTLTGTNFRAGATVNVGGTAATNVVVVSPTQITATAPAHAAGTVNVVVSNSDQQSATKTAAFTYLAPAPTVASVSPISGPTAGGTTVTITGNNFVSGATVKFGTTSSTSVTFVSSTSVRAVAPALAAGVKDVTVTNPDGQAATKVAAYTYTSPVPTVSALSANSGFAAGGNTITVTGTNFITGATVSFGGTAATSVTVVNATTITLTVPARTAGEVSVVVTTSNGSSTGITYTYRLNGDSNADGRVNGLDYSVLASNINTSYAPADYNSDGTVGAADLAMLLAAWTW